MSAIFHLTLGDLLPALAGTLEDLDGHPVALDEAESVSLHVRSPGALAPFMSLPSIAFSAAPVGAASCGHVEHVWTEQTRPKQPGAYQAQFRAHFPGGRAQTAPNPGYVTILVGPSAS